MSYENLRKIRSLIIDELLSDFPKMSTVDLLQIAEMRVQSVLIGALDIKTIEESKINWSKKNK